MKFLKTEEKPESVGKVVDKKTSKRVFINLLIAITIMAYFCILSIVYKNVGLDLITTVVKVATMVFLTISLILLEIAYKKESKKFVIHSFEILALAIHSLTTMHVIRINNFDFNNYILISSYAFSIYYVLKTIIITTKARKEFLNGLSDISQIVQKEEPRKKEASKKDKKIDKDFEEAIAEVANEMTENEEDVIIEDNINESEEEKNEDSKEELKDYSNDKLAKLREKIKKLQEEDQKLNKKIKKEEPSENENDEKKETEIIENKPKKRGRPKKVVNETVEKPDENIAKQTRKR